MLFSIWPPLWRNKAAFWDDLMKLGGLNDKPWVCVGDFNDIIKQGEKRGGRFVSGSSSRELK